MSRTGLRSRTNGKYRRAGDNRAGIAKTLWMISHRFYDKACRQAYRRAVGSHQRARLKPLEVDNTIPGTLLRSQLQRTHPATAIVTRAVALPLEATIASQLLDKPEEMPSDLRRYVALICARGVTDACGALINMVDIPAFIMGDILTRLPRLRRELDLQVDIWFEYGPEMAALLEPSRVQGYFENLLGYAIGYYGVLAAKFLRFLAHLVTVLPGERPQVVNYAMWQLIRKFYAANIHHSQSSHHLVAVYELLVGYLPRPVADLDLYGIGSIAMAVFTQLPAKARQLWGRHPAYINGASMTKAQQHVIDAVELSLCTKPETLLASFNQVLARGGLTLWLWLMFLRKLRPLGILTEERAITVMKQLEKHAHDTLVTRDIVEAVLATVKLYKGLIAVTTSLEAMGIEPQLRSILVPRHIRLLYRHRLQGLRYHPFPWSPPEAEAKQMLALDYARQLFELMPVHTNQAIGEFLDGELMAEPSQVWNHYKRLVMTDNVPNATSLVALIRAARKGRWEWQLADGSTLFAPQIAVHQWKRHVATTRMGQVGWQQYLHLLAQNSYTDELAAIIKWWELLGFVPNRHTLLVLLRLLPRDHALRHIDHYHKVKHDLAKVPPPKVTPADVLHWPWPTKDELGPDIGAGP